MSEYVAVDLLARLREIAHSDVVYWIAVVAGCLMLAMFLLSRFGRK